MDGLTYIFYEYNWQNKMKKYIKVSLIKSYDLFFYMVFVNMLALEPPLVAPQKFGLSSPDLSSVGQVSNQL